MPLSVFMPRVYFRRDFATFEKDVHLRAQERAEVGGLLRGPCSLTRALTRAALGCVTALPLCLPKLYN